MKKTVNDDIITKMNKNKAPDTTNQVPNDIIFDSHYFICIWLQPIYNDNIAKANIKAPNNIKHPICKPK